MTAAADPIQLDAMNALLARNWWAVALRGLAAIIFGLVALLAPGAAILSLLMVFSVLMLVDGALSVIAGLRSARRHERWGPLVLQGVVSVVVGLAAAVMPGITLLAFIYLLAGWAVATGALAIAATVRLRGDHGRWWMGFSGALSIVGGILLAAAPLIGAVVLAWWLGAYAIVFGATLLALAFRLRSRHIEATHGAAAHPA